MTNISFKRFDVEAYKPGKSSIKRFKKIIKLSANESALGMSSWTHAQSRFICGKFNYFFKSLNTRFAWFVGFYIKSLKTYIGHLFNF